MTRPVGAWLREAERRLSEAGGDASALEAQLLACAALTVERTWLFAHPDATFDVETADVLLARRLHGEPLAYILGWREFYGRRFGVDPSVLIPRQETETLVEAALQCASKRAKPELDILDFGAGSGVLGITLKLERPKWHVTAIDVSPEALATASANAKFHHATIRFVLSDGFYGLLGETFDMIVANPPYVADNSALPREVADFEPPAALFAGLDGLSFYRLFAAEAQHYLNPGGSIWVEVGAGQAEAVAQLFADSGWRVLGVRKDLSGHQRVVGATWELEQSTL